MRLEYVPVKDVRQLRVEFPMPDLTEYYDCNVSLVILDACMRGGREEGGGRL